MKNSERALEKFNSGYNCAQAVIFALAGDAGLDPDLAVKLSTGFGGGFGRKQEVCGAVSGAVMALSMKYGRGEGEAREKADRCYEKVREYIDAFKAESGALLCRDLLSGCNTLTEEGQRFYKEHKLRDRCCTYVALCCDLFEKI